MRGCNLKSTLLQQSQQLRVYVIAYPDSRDVILDDQKIHPTDTILLCSQPSAFITSEAYLLFDFVSRTYTYTFWLSLFLERKKKTTSSLPLPPSENIAVALALLAVVDVAVVIVAATSTSTSPSTTSHSQ